MPRPIKLETVLAELFSAPEIINDWESFIRLAPVVNVYAVIGNDVTVTFAIGRQESTVIEFETIRPPGCSAHDLNLPLFKADLPD